MSNTKKGVRLASWSEARSLNPDGNKKLRCPNCGKLSFVPYIYAEGPQQGKPIDIKLCGRCDHADSCGYHLPPGEYFTQYPDRRPNNGMSEQEKREEWKKQRELLKKEAIKLQRTQLLQSLQDNSIEGQKQADADASKYIPWKYVERSEKRAKATAFYTFLCKHFNTEDVDSIFSKYHVAGDIFGRVIFWQIDENNIVRTGKVMRYRPDGHRAKDAKGDPLPGSFNWIHSILNEEKQLPDNWELNQCMFGTHLAPEAKRVVLVESEKSALVGALAAPEYTWVATGGKYNLKSTMLRPFKDCNIIAIPDLGAFAEWSKKIESLKGLFSIVVSDIIEQKATELAKSKGMDVADYLLKEF